MSIPVERLERDVATAAPLITVEILESFAEHATKAFARLRNVIGANSTAKSMRDYLVLLSVAETCKCKGLNFLSFLRSGAMDINEFDGNF
jgi:hypothetical protein